MHHFKLDLFVIKFKYRWPSLFADLVFAVLTIRGPENRGNREKRENKHSLAKF